MPTEDTHYSLYLKGALPRDGLRLMLAPQGVTAMSPVSGHLRNGPLGLLVIVTPLTRPVPEREILKDQLKLTESEAKVAQLFAEGLSPAAIAERRGTTLGTTQNQIKSLKEKIGISSQTRLLIELLRFSS